MNISSNPVDAIAIVGMAGRFPGARNIAEYWENLCKGVEGITSFTREELIAEGKSPALLDNPDYVPRRGIIQGIELFDAEFFGFSPREATVTDPQQRLFMECAWEALETAGYSPDACRTSIGVYAGMGFGEYLFHLYSDQELFRRSDPFHMLFGNDKDYLATRTAYKFNLRGPSVNVNTACSTSLVAVSMACQALRNGECDMALAGGVRLNFPQIGGHLFQEGSIMSPDGHCRAFDAKAQGTVGGNGVGVVVLKRLEEAVADGDEVIAVIRGYAINNDGGQKVGFTAPSVEGQAAVICEALANAGVEPETVTYVEGHGTGTQLGDPIEVEALTRAFRQGTEKKQYCVLGSVKSNVGHLDAAAGVAGLIKAALAVKEGKIPGTLHYEEGNREIRFEASPFYVTGKLEEWNPGVGVRRAGVSSFGIGGTNAHVVLEEGPGKWKGTAGREKQLLVVSGRTEEALKDGARNLREHLERRRGEWRSEELADGAYTLAVGRKGFGHRLGVICGSVEEGIERLKEERRKEEEAGGGVVRGEWKGGRRKVGVVLSGQGSQYVGMGRELYRKERVFREEIDRQSEYLKGEMGIDVREVMFAEGGGEEERKAGEKLRETWMTQPALYVLERGLLRQWESWGVEWEGMLGHSLGELVAAREAGVLSEEEGLRLVAARGRLMWKTRRGGMLSALLGEEEGRKYEGGGVEIGAVNGREQVVYTGGEEEIGKLEEELKRVGVVVKRLEVERAFHSALMEEVKEEYLKVVKGLRLRKPEKRYISNVTGRWAGEEVREAEYWWEQMRRRVRFVAGVEEMLKEGEWVWLEVGPGESLGRLVGGELRRRGERGVVVGSLGGREKKGEEQAQMVQGLGKMWVQGVEVDWKKYYAGERRRRIPLPTYPFQRQKYVISSVTPAQAAAATSQPSSTATIAANPQPPRTSSLAKETNMQTAQKPKRTRPDAITEKLCTAWANLLGIDPARIDPYATFFELGVDSLLLIQVSKVILEEFKIKLPFRKLLEEFTTIHSLAIYLDEKLPAGQFEPAVEVEEPVPAPPVAVVAQPVIAQPDLPLVLGQNGSGSNGSHPGVDAGVNAIIAQQLQLMARQLEILNGTRIAGIPSSSRPVAAPARVPNHEEIAAKPEVSVSPTISTVTAPAGQKPEPFVPYQPVRPHAAGELTEQQRKYLHEFMGRYNKRTAGSKEHFHKNHSSFADNRALQGFRLPWKEIIYPIVGRRSEGARMWDLDGNAYIDMTMGFGVHLFGHSPEFVTAALEKQIKQGLQLGPQTELAGKVAASLSEITGMQRVTFCNSGTEAVMAALRLARAATGRDKIAMFAGSYHGTFDGNLARIEKGRNGDLKTVPAGPGIPQNMVADVTALYYNEVESLDFLKSHGTEYAAVLVEPVQSRRPDIQPREFLHELRRLTEQSGTALIFDDIINGFRIHPGGTQAWFGVKADLATYGKVIAGGLPVGIVAGKDSFMDGIDGGAWSYGDQSYPQADQIIFAGTFCKHPLTMAACDAVLQQLQECGPGLQEELNQRSGRFVESLNALLEKYRAPMRAVNFGSLIRFLLPGNPRYMDLFFYHLINNGVFVWEGRTAFISTAHTDQDLQLVLQAFEKTILDMRAAGLLEESPLAEPEIAAKARPEQNAGQPSIRSVPATQQQKQLWALAQLGRESSSAYNESIVLTVHGELQAAALQKALKNVVQRHESLRTVFSADGEFQRILPELDIPIPFLDLSHQPYAEIQKSQALQEEASTWFDLLNGPLLRVLLIKLAPDSFVFSIVAHHSIMDGWSGSTFLRDLSGYYGSEISGEKFELKQPMQFADYVQWQSTQNDLPGVDESRKYWLERFADGVPRLELPTEGPRPPVYTHAGGQARLTFGSSVYQQIRGLNKQHGFTMFNVLLSAYTLLLARLSRQQDFVVGMHSAGHSLVDGQDLVGHCINLLPLRSTFNPNLSFLEHAASCRGEVFDACEHQFYPYSKLAKDLNLPRDPSRLTFVEVVFNLDQTVSDTQLFGYTVEVDAAFSGYTKWDLSWNVSDTGKDLSIRCDYNRDLFSAETVQRWLEDYELVLNAVTNQPHKKLAEVFEEVEMSSRRKRDQRIKTLKAANLEKLRNLRKKTAPPVTV